MPKSNISRRTIEDPNTHTAGTPNLVTYLLPPLDTLASRRGSTLLAVLLERVRKVSRRGKGREW